jgi:hypothetical protein
MTFKESHLKFNYTFIISQKSVLVIFAEPYGIVSPPP